MRWIFQIYAGFQTYEILHKFLERKGINKNHFKVLTL